MAIDVKRIARERQAALARLSPIAKEHRQAARSLSSSKAEAMATIRDRKTVVENIRVTPGFFPTPKAVAQKMVDLADLGSGLSICEPSAGAGAIADEIRAAGHEPTCVEFSQTLAGILTRKGYKTITGDFLEVSQTFDRFIMNPPFENGQDIDHVLHAFKLLNHGGRIVSIMSNGVFYRSDKKASIFREWFEGVGYISDDLPAGTFSESGTGVASKIVVIDYEYS